MVDEIVDGSNNSNDSSADNSQAQSSDNGEGQVEEQTGATEGTAEPKTEFSDPNMQAKFTQRMQELSAKEKEYNAALEKSNKYEKLLQDDRFKNYFKDNVLTKKVETIPEFTDDDYVAALSDKNKMREFIKREAMGLLGDNVNPLKEQVTQASEQLAEIRLIQDINDFAEAKDDSGKVLHPDFDELNKAGKIEPYLVKLRSANMPDIEKIELAYKLCKSDNINSEITNKAHNIVSQKKQAIGEKGNTAQVPVKKTGKRSMAEIAMDAAKELGMELP